MDTDETLLPTDAQSTIQSQTVSLLQATARTRNAWGSEHIPYWDELTPEEQQEKWDKHLEEVYGPDIDTPACLVCQDRRWLYPKVNGNPDYSQAVPCSCACWTDEQRRVALRSSGIPEVRFTETLHNFTPVPGANDALDACWQLAAGVAPYRMLLVYGLHGCGKTHLLRGTVIEYVTHHPGQPVRYCTVRGLATEIRRRFGSPEADALLDEIKGCSCLALDEIGTEDPQSTWQAGLVEDLLNYRYDRRLATCLACNGDVSALPPAILSRLKDRSTSRMVLNRAPDYRAKKGA